MPLLAYRVQWYECASVWATWTSHEWKKDTPADHDQLLEEIGCKADALRIGVGRCVSSKSGNVTTDGGQRGSCFDGLP